MAGSERLPASPARERDHRTGTEAARRVIDRDIRVKHESSEPRADGRRCRCGEDGHTDLSVHTSSNGVELERKIVATRIDV